MKRSSSKFTHITNLNSISSVNDILAELIRHEQVLVGTEIEKLIYFSRTYAIINRNINLACKNSYFLDPTIMISLQKQFAHKYFKTLNNYAKTGFMPRQWRVASNHRLISFQPAGLSLFLAIYAHIKCDAVDSLKRLNPDLKLLASDYSRVNQLLRESSREIVKSYNPNPRLSLMREIARKILIMPICIIIFGWRGEAWCNFLETIKPSREHEAKLHSKNFSLQNPKFNHPRSTKRGGIEI